MIGDGETMIPLPEAGPEQVQPDDQRLYDLEAAVVAATPNVLDTGTPEDFQKFLEKGGEPSTFLWYDEQGNLVGYLALSEIDASDEVEVRSIAVAPDHQRAGHGKAMMLFAEDFATQRKKPRLTLVTSPDNEPALEFYDDLGYKITKTVENYYGDGTPRHVLEKPL